MSVRVRKVDESFGIWDSYNMEFVNPSYLGISEARIKDYIKGNKEFEEPPQPFPKSPEGEFQYSEEDMIQDMTNSEGSLIIPGTEDQAYWIADMIQELL